MSALCLGGVLLTQHTPPDEDYSFGHFIASRVDLDAYRHGKLVANLHLDTIRLTGKKKGFIRLGFWKVLRMDDVTLDVYPPLSQKILAGKSIFEMLQQHDAESSAAENGNPALFLKMLDNRSSQPIPPARGVELHQVTWRLHGDKGDTFELSCGFAEFDFNRKNFIFTDKVKIVYGRNERMVKADRIEWDMERGILQIPDSYTFYSEGKSGGGKGLRTDLYLSRLGAAADR